MIFSLAAASFGFYFAAQTWRGDRCRMKVSVWRTDGMSGPSGVIDEDTYFTPVSTDLESRSTLQLFTGDLSLFSGDQSRSSNVQLCDGE